MNEFPVKWKRMDEKGLSPCSHEESSCPHPMTCLRRKASGIGGDFYDVAEDVFCQFYVQSELLRDEGKIFRGKARRHNRHAAPAGSTFPRGSALGSGSNVSGGSLGSGDIVIPGLPSEPDLLVTRHIRSGKDINDGE